MGGEAGGMVSQGPVLLPPPGADVQSRQDCLCLSCSSESGWHTPNHPEFPNLEVPAHTRGPFTLPPYSEGGIPLMAALTTTSVALSVAEVKVEFQNPWITTSTELQSLSAPTHLVFLQK